MEANDRDVFSMMKDPGFDLFEDDKKSKNIIVMKKEV